MEQDHRTSRTPQPAADPARPPTLPDGPAVGVDADLAGTVLGGRYRLEEVIGTGAMGVVWTAWDRRLRRTVAVKQLAAARDGQSDAVAARLARTRAMREGRIAARVVHPRAIAVFDAVDHDSMPWLVMEYLPSRSLAAVLADHGPLDPAAVAHIGTQIADALIAVHDAGIVHGDVKPGNVLLTDDGVAKLTDFGVSRASWDTSATGGGIVAGTPGYFAPEVARGADPTPASDVFSLGATLYAAVENELVCGRLDNTLAVLHAMAEGRLRPAVRAGVLERPLAAMLRPDPTGRPGTTAVRDLLAARGRDAGPLVAAAVTASGVPDPDGTGTPPDGTGTGTGTDADGTAAHGTAGPGGRAADVDAGPDERAGGTQAPPPLAPRPAAGGEDGRDTGAGDLVPGLPGAGGPAARAGDARAAGRPEPVSALDRVITPTAVGTARPRPRLPRRRRRLAVVAAVSGIVIAAGVGAGIAAVGDPSPRASTQASAPATSTAAVPADAPEASGAVPAALPTAAAPISPGTSSATPAPSAAAGDPVDEDDVRSTVADYYGSLPEDIPGAWAVLSPEARDASGGYGTYERFWSGISEVTAGDVRVDGDTATTTLQFVTTSGRSTREGYRFTVERDGTGTLRILSASRGSDSA